MADAITAAAPHPQATAAQDLAIRYRQGTVKDCEWVRRIICDCGYITYEGLEDGPTEAHFAADWAGRWADRLVDPDQVYAVAETERYKGTPEVVGFARMQRNRPQMRMTALATHLLSGGDAPTEASAVDELENELVGPQYDAELMSLFIAPDLRRHGMGTQLMKLVSELAWTQLGAKTAFTWCVDDEASRRFYRDKCGGTAIGLKHDTNGVPGSRDDEVRTQTAFAFELAVGQRDPNGGTAQGTFLEWAAGMNGVALGCGAELRLLRVADAEAMFDAIALSADFLRPYLSWVDSPDIVAQWLADPAARATALAAHTEFVKETCAEIKQGKHLAVAVWKGSQMRGLVELHDWDAEHQRAGLSYWRDAREPPIRCVPFRGTLRLHCA